MTKKVPLVIKFVNLLQNAKINKAHRKSKGLETVTHKEIQPISEVLYTGRIPPTNSTTTGSMTTCTTYLQQHSESQ